MSFDASIWEVWPYLAAGACVHIYGRETLAAPAELMRRIAGDAIDFAFLPTPVAEAVLDEEWPAHTRLKVLLTGGDALHRAPRRAQPFTLVNHYGLTEARVVATCGVVEPGEGVPSIGKPISNTRLYIVDRALNLVPVGAAGELCIAGDGLARGYRHRDALTHAQFVDCPFESAGARMYRTGDRARYREDGSVEFFGRLDQQVKIRGLRIEPGEVEAVLRAHECVREAAVVARAARGGEKQLVAYAVLDRPMEKSELREYLRKRLPEYMLPAALVVIDEMPMNNSGKIDRSALPDPERGSENAAAVVAPRNELERKIAAAWREVLGVEHVGVDQNFFELGGHSLLLVKLQERLQKALGRVVGVMDLFQHPTVAALARTLAYPLLEKPDVSALKERAARQRKSMLRRISEARPELDVTETLKPTEATKDSRRTRQRIRLRPLQKES
jgi:aryl carrier-like protein